MKALKKEKYFIKYNLPEFNISVLELYSLEHAWYTLSLSNAMCYSSLYSITLPNGIEIEWNHKVFKDCFERKVTSINELITQQLVGVKN